jgi:hypothetical protein
MSDQTISDFVNQFKGLNSNQKYYDFEDHLNDIFGLGANGEIDFQNPADVNLQALLTLKEFKVTAIVNTFDVPFPTTQQEEIDLINSYEVHVVVKKKG